MFLHSVVNKKQVFPILNAVRSSFIYAVTNRTPSIYTYILYIQICFVLYNIVYNVVLLQSQQYKRPRLDGSTSPVPAEYKVRIISF